MNKYAAVSSAQSGRFGGPCFFKNPLAGAGFRVMPAAVPRSSVVVMAKGGGNKMTKEDAARIQSATALANGGQIEKGSFAWRAQRAANRGHGAS